MRTMVAAVATAIAIHIAAPLAAQQSGPTSEEIQRRLDAMPPEKRQKLLDRLSKALAGMELYSDLQSGKCNRAPEVRIKALQGDPESTYTLSEMYRNGWCVPKDAGQFHASLEKAARLGVASAAFDIGYYLHYGNEGYQKDISGATEWFERATQQNEPRAMIQLGSMLIEGELRKDVSRGLQLLNAVADQGSENLEASDRALGLLALYYLSGEFVPRNLGASAKYALRGAAQCDAGAMNILGSLYQITAPPDLIQAYAWNFVANEHGNDQQKAIAQNGMADISKHLPPNAVAKAKPMAKALPICLPAGTGG